jgi:hypothetical protein
MSRGILVRTPVSKGRYTITAATAGTHILTSAWKELVSSMEKACDAVEILNSTGRVLLIGVGAAASEVEQNWYLMPSSEPHLVPLTLSKGDRISAKAVGADADETSQIVFNFYG